MGYLTQEQIKGMLDRLIAVLLAWLAAKAVQKGWLGESDAAQLLPAVVLLPSLAWAWWTNRNKALQQAAANTVAPDGTKPIIVTSAAMAESTPEANILSSEKFKVSGPKGVVLEQPTTIPPPSSKMSRFE